MHHRAPPARPSRTRTHDPRSLSARCPADLSIPMPPAIQAEPALASPRCCAPPPGGWWPTGRPLQPGAPQLESDPIQKGRRRVRARQCVTKLARARRELARSHGRARGTGRGSTGRPGRHGTFDGDAWPACPCLRHVTADHERVYDVARPTHLLPLRACACRRQRSRAAGTTGARDAGGATDAYYMGPAGPSTVTRTDGAVHACMREPNKPHTVPSHERASPPAAHVLHASDPSPLARA